ncbi:glyoxalase [Flavobacterium sp. J372]|uniref:glyoxalase n=1 Tax=Flavobacterium sp. J372 TaxID=2898436 RepID=UPI002150D656|nr:glyoxalase [Flavobacterium sp. J372]MCR5862873.1 glyoxalase [Flavobacterium sp. J372]
MNNRDEALLQLRGEAIGEIFPQSSKDEIFQNRTLRPILKLQNDLFIESFINYVNKSKSDFYNMGTEKKMAFIDNAVHKDIKFRNALKGMVMAMFTVEEFREYILNSSDLNKRMMNMLIERLKDQVQLLVNPK